MAIRDELRQFNDGFSQAMADQDVERVVAYYTDDAQLLFAGAPMIRGREAITAAFRDDLKDGPGIIRFESGEIFEGGDLVVDVGRLFTPNTDGKYVVVFRRQPDGSLKIAVDAASSDGPRSA